MMCYNVSHSHNSFPVDFRIVRQQFFIRSFIYTFDTFSNSDQQHTDALQPFDPTWRYQEIIR